LLLVERIGGTHNQPMFKAFSGHRFTVDGAEIFGRVGGTGPALLLLHGHPQNHVMWHRVAEPLAQRFTVVALDLRGYGDSSIPASDAQHAPYSKRVMARDMLAVMSQLGHALFDVAAHDRGARVAHRLAADHPGSVRRLMLLDIAPTLAMYEGATQEFARAYWHWFFLIQPAPLPERLIARDPVFYLRSVMGSRHAGLAAFDPRALAEYERCIARAGAVAAICEDYRASCGIDLEHDRADRGAGSLIQMPLRVLWGAHGTVARCFDVLALWRERARQVSGRPLDCGHYIAEERPAELLGEMLEFFKE
jgi:haloacetate dehalogenase